jgi:hypothetical protein
MADDFTIKKGDLLPALAATLQPATGQTFTLAGATVRLVMWNAKAVKIAAGVCTVVDATARTVRYDWLAGDTDTAEGYLATFQVTFPGGVVETFPNGTALVIRVTP